MQERTILLDGRFLSLSHAGIGRYSSELFRNILLQDKKNKYILLISPKTQFDPALSMVIKKSERPIEIVEFEAKHYSLREQSALLKLLNDIKPDLVHFPHFTHPILYKGKFIVTIHDLTLSKYAERSNPIKNLAYKMVISKAAKNSSMIITDSEYTKREIAKQFQLPSSRIAVTYLGIDEKFQKITNPKSLEKAANYGLLKPYILYVGQWRSHKNLLRLVEAFKILLENNKELAGKMELVFAGRVDPKYPELPQLVKKLKLQGDVRFTDFVKDEDLPIIYNDALVFAFPTLSEGFGLPALEAQACGVPVMSSDKTCMPEILGRGAIYCNALDVNDIAKKLEKVISNQDLRKELVKEGFLNSKKFSWEDAAQKTLEVYSSLLYK